MPAWVDGAFVTDHAGPPAPGTTDEPTGRYAAEHDHDWSVRRTRHRRTCRSAEAAQLGRKDELELIHDSIPNQRPERLGIHDASQIGRESGRARVGQYVSNPGDDDAIKKKKNENKN